MNADRAPERRDTEFDRDIASVRAGAGPDAEHRIDLSPGWRVGGGVNGGYLLAVIGRACAEVARAASDDAHPDPFVVTAHYLSASRPGPARIRTDLVRSGGSLTTVAARLEQGDDVRVSAQVACGNLEALTDQVKTTATEPDLPPVEDCVTSADAPRAFTDQAPLLQRFDLRADPACAGWAVGEPSRRGMLQGWFRLAQGRELDALALLFAVDALPPVTFDLGIPGWAPTLELSVHVRARPAPGWAKLRHATRNVAGGYFEEDCEVWDSAGRLVAQSRQLAMMPRRTPRA